MLALILAAGLSTPPAVERGQVTFRPTAQESDVPERFRLPAATFAFETERRLVTSTYSVSAVRFPSPVVSPDPENNTVHAEYFRPTAVKHGARRVPAVVVLHI